MTAKPQLKLRSFLATVAVLAGIVAPSPSSLRPATAATTYVAPSNASRIAAGDGFLCMAGGSISSPATVLCSGLNTFGQLGDGTTTNRTGLTAIANSSKIQSPKAVAVGSKHACAISGSGSDSPGAGVLYCWGDNTWGQLGNGTNTSSSSPVQVSDNGSFTNSDIAGVVAGREHTCAVNSTMKLFCWGLNAQGQLGDGTTTNRNVPTAVAGVFTAGTTQASANFYPWVAAGDIHTCAALSGTNRVYCWGDNTSGQLGDGTTTSRTLPVDTGTSGGAAGVANTYKSPIAAGLDFTCVRDTATLKCWGDNSRGQLGDGSNTQRLTPTAVSSSTGLNQADSWSIAAGGQTACAISNTSGSSSYTVWCWGANDAGQVGDNTTVAKNTPTKVLDNSAAGFDNESANMGPNSMFENPWGLTVGKSVTNGFACVTMWCWGKNNAGQFAQGNTTDAPLAVKVGIATVTPTTTSTTSTTIAARATTATGAKATAVLKGGKVEVTFSDLPASALSRVSVVVTPTSFDLSTPRFGASYTDYDAVNLTGSDLPTVTNNGFTITVDKMTKRTYTNGVPSSPVVENFTTTGSYHIRYSVTGATMAGYPNGWIARNVSSPSFVPLSVTAEATTTTTTTTAAATTTTVANVYAAAKPGITVTDTKVYTAPPAEVAASSAINVLTKAQNKVMDVQTKTPAVCVPNDDELVFIDEGKCIAEVVNAKTRAVLRTLKTTVVADDISEVKVGNEIVTLAPIYFDVMSTKVDAKAMGRLRSLKTRISAAGSVLLIGHSGTLNGNSPANVAVSKARAESTLAALKSIRAQGPFAIAGVGALDPASNGKTEADQAKNRRVVIVLIP